MRAFGRKGAGEGEFGDDYCYLAVAVGPNGDVFGVHVGGVRPGELQKPYGTCVSSATEMLVCLLRVNGGSHTRP